MTMPEILSALKQMKNDDRALVIETAARLMREEAERKALQKAERDRRLEAAAKKALPDYLPGGALASLWSPDSKPYYSSSDEYPIGAVNAKGM